MAVRNWASLLYSGAIMNNFIMLLAFATFFAAGTALWVTLAFFNHERALRRQKAIVVRAQILGNLLSLREVIVPRSLDEAGVARSSRDRRRRSNRCNCFGRRLTC